MDIDLKEFNLTTSNSGPYGIDVAQDGKVWFTQHKANKISCMNKNGEIQEFTVPTNDAQVMCLIVSSSGDIWFTEYSANKIGKLAPSGVFCRISPAT
jgi:virginiamycin B lyase